MTKKQHYLTKELFRRVRITILATGCEYNKKRYLEIRGLILEGKIRWILEPYIDYICTPGTCICSVCHRIVRADLYHQGRKRCPNCARKGLTPDSPLHQKPVGSLHERDMDLYDNLKPSFRGF